MWTNAIFEVENLSEYKQVVILNKLYPYCPGWDTSNPKPPFQIE